MSKTGVSLADFSSYGNGATTHDENTLRGLVPGHLPAEIRKAGAAGLPISNGQLRVPQGFLWWTII